MNRLVIPIFMTVALGCTSPTAQTPVTRKRLIKSSYEISNPAVRVKLIPQAPPYPTTARTGRISGDVVLNVTINSTGIPITAKAIDGPSELIPTAEIFIMKIQFYPVVQNGVATETTFQFIMPFRLY